MVVADPAAGVASTEPGRGDREQRWATAVVATAWRPQRSPVVVTGSSDEVEPKFIAAMEASTEPGRGDREQTRPTVWARWRILASTEPGRGDREQLEIIFTRRRNQSASTEPGRGDREQSRLRRGRR